MAAEDNGQIIDALGTALKEARACMLDMSVRLDVTTLGQCKWRLMRGAANVTAVLRETQIERP